FFFDVPAPTVTITLSLHDALPIWSMLAHAASDRKAMKIRKRFMVLAPEWVSMSMNPVQPDNHGSRCINVYGSEIDAARRAAATLDRKSTRLNSSHVKTSYAVSRLK